MSKHQKHTVATDALETLGTFPIPDNSGRDAIHLAVEPVLAGEKMAAGDRIRSENGIAYRIYRYDNNEATGIVDPFVSGIIQPGEKFWLVVLPRTITSLRHVWSHPLFPEEPVSSYHADADDHYVASPSEQWLRDYARQIDEPFEDLISAAGRFVARGDYFYGTACGDPGDEYYGKFEGESTHPDFWRHYQAFKSVDVPKDKQRSFFTCSC